jgi:hypothetical protein
MGPIKILQSAPTPLKKALQKACVFHVFGPGPRGLRGPRDVQGHTLGFRDFRDRSGHKILPTGAEAIHAPKTKTAPQTSHLIQGCPHPLDPRLGPAAPKPSALFWGGSVPLISDLMLLCVGSIFGGHASRGGWCWGGERGGAAENRWNTQ